MRPLLITGPDSSLSDTYELALEAWPERRIEKIFFPSKDYYDFDISGLKNYSPLNWDIVVAVNEFYINDVRRALQKKISDLGYKFNSIISPLAKISVDATIGVNTIIHSGCFIGSNSKVGSHCVLRPNVVLSENVNIKDYATLEANVAIRELCSIGNFVTICANSSLLRSTTIEDHCYLNITRQYSGKISTGTFFSPFFPEPIKIIGATKNQH